MREPTWIWHQVLQTFPKFKGPILHQAILNCIQSVFHNKEEIAEAVREAQKKIILFEDAKNNPEVIRQRMQDIDHGMANLLTLAAQSSQTELFEKKFKEMTEEKARLTEQLKQAEEDATTDAKRQKQLSHNVSFLLNYLSRLRQSKHHACC